MATREIDLETYEAKPGDLITALLIQKIIDTINSLAGQVGTLQNEVNPAPSGGAPPVVLNVFTPSDELATPPAMLIDLSISQPTTVTGTGLEDVTLVRLDSLEVNFKANTGQGVTSLSLSGLDGLLGYGSAAGTPGYEPTPAGAGLAGAFERHEGYSISLLAVSNPAGTGTRIVYVKR